MGDTDLSISESEQEIINSISSNVSMSTLIIFWQFIIKTLDEMSIVSSPILSLEMLIFRLIHLKDLPSYEHVLDALKNDNLNLSQKDNNLTIDLSNNKKKLMK